MRPSGFVAGIDLEGAAEILDRRLTITFSLTRPSALDERVAGSLGDRQCSVRVGYGLVELTDLDVAPRPLGERLVIAPLQIDQAGQILDGRAMVAESDAKLGT